MLNSFKNCFFFGINNNLSIFSYKIPSLRNLQNSFPLRNSKFIPVTKFILTTKFTTFYFEIKHHQNQLSKRKNRFNLLGLPTEILLLIFKEFREKNGVGELVMLRKTCRRFNNIINVVIRDELEFNKYIWNFKFKFTYKNLTWLFIGERDLINEKNNHDGNIFVNIFKGRYLSNVSNLNLNALPSVKPKFTWRCLSNVSNSNLNAYPPYLPGCFGVWTSKIGSIHQLRTNLKVSKPNYSFEGQLGNIRNIRFFLANQSSYLKKKEGPNSINLVEYLLKYPDQMNAL
uniref:F-box domain-containing protein n=1 Tax=Rhizophagus irregularis (strain DAOM 181602 / DAOM 197198 / MUCL 43194) TaxID=747089 RepID=U9SIZ3_RHIID